MMRYLPALILSAILGSMVLVQDAQACHGKRKCGCTTAVVYAAPQPACVQPVACFKPKLTLCFRKPACAQPAPCVKPVACAKPAPCAKPVVAACAPKRCGFKLPTLCKRTTTLACAGPAPCTAAPVAYALAAPQSYVAPTLQH
jgi:hypothetical protein